MADGRTILDVLDERARTTAAVEVFAELGRDGQLGTRINFLELRTAAQRFAERLVKDTPKDQPLLICADPGLDFVVAFYACLYAGRIAVPAVLPRPERIGRLISIVTDSGATHIVISEQQRSRFHDLAPLSQLVAELTPIAVTRSAKGNDVDVSSNVGLHRKDAIADNVALLQYTSGSTGQAKGVMITHRNLMANSSIIAERFGHDETSRGLIWLPPYHDMGLIGGVIQPVFCGFFTVLMSPERFVMMPMLWLRSISNLRITTSGGPNFAYELCVRRASSASPEGLDLSCWKVAFAGAERVQPATMARFSETFAPAAFNPRALLPCYGLAEATLYVSGRARGSGISVVDVPMQSGRSTPSVSCGSPARPLDLRIINPDTGEEVSAGKPGEIWLRGDSVSPGYWNSSIIDANFRGRMAGECEPFLRTGDIARLIDGEIHVAGRLKAIIVVNGINYQCEELEQIAASVDQDLAKHATSLIQPISPDGAEKLVLVQELTAGASAERRDILRESIKRATSAVGIVLDQIVFIGPGRLPRTDSGKIRRWMTCELFSAGEFVERVPKEAVG